MLRRTLGKWCTKAAAPAAAAPQSEFEKQYKSLGSGLQGGVKEKTSIAVLIPRQGTGSLMKVLQHFKDHDISLDRLTSRPSAWHENNENVTMFIDWGLHMDDPRSKAIFESLRKSQRYVQLLGSWRVPWFASCGEELDLLEQKTMAAGADLQDDPTNPHPGFHDDEYKARRRMISEVAAQYRHGQPLPIIDYTQQEKDTWTAVWDQLTMLFPTHACRTYNRTFQLLVERAGYCRTEIPQLRDVNEFLLDQTGFTLRPVAGLLSTRDFFNALALRIFYSTQYIRHHSKPLYTPEPDLVHELVGHVPLFADPDFADFSQAIGLASLGASDEVIEQLGRVYWYSVEFGLCREAGGVRAYGSGILSSFGELQYALSKEPQLRAWDPFEAAKLPFPITTYQPVYFVAENFKDALVKFREFMTSLDPPFQVKFNQAARRVKAFSHTEE